MTEYYLHYLWQVKRLPVQLHTTAQKDLHILDFGTYNAFESGPDFNNAKISFDGLEFAGNIEMHLRSSDWYRHGHDRDPAFENVILHVVYEHDREVFINGQPVPVLELRDLIPSDHYQLYLRLQTVQREILCEPFFQETEQVYFEKLKERNLFTRLERKSAYIEELYAQTGNTAQAFYLLIAKSFGGKVNDLPFTALAERVPLALLERSGFSEHLALLYLVSGLGSPENNAEATFLQRKYRLDSLPSHTWKRKGLRPVSFPEVKLVQFAHFIRHFPFYEALWEWSAEDLIRLVSGIAILPMHKESRAFLIESGIAHSAGKTMNSGTTDLILINALAPFLFWQGMRREDASCIDKAFDLLERTKAEKNVFVRKWEKLGVRAKSAWDSQALLEIFCEFCKRKRCLSCDVGSQILNYEPHTENSILF